MKYLSLIELMRMYGCLVKNNRSLMTYNREITTETFDTDASYSPFIIGSVSDTVKEALDMPQEQVLKKLSLNFRHRAPYLYGVQLPEFIVLPPILEMEWLRTKLDWDDEVMNVLEQLSYFLVFHVVLHGQRTVVNHPNIASWIEYLTGTGVIIEVEDLNDTPEILLQNPLPHVTLPNTRSWVSYVVYGRAVESVLEFCIGNGQMVEQIYFQLPNILAMFMVDYFGCELQNWSKRTKIEMEQTIRSLSQGYLDLNILPVQKYTYGCSTCITQKDNDLCRIVFETIYEKLREVNSNIGLISYRNYKLISGPNRSRASVRLSDMGIVWDDEIFRAKENLNDNVQEGVSHG